MAVFSWTNIFSCLCDLSEGFETSVYFLPKHMTQGWCSVRQPCRFSSNGKSTHWSSWLVHLIIIIVVHTLNMVTNFVIHVCTESCRVLSSISVDNNSLFSRVEPFTTSCSCMYSGLVCICVCLCQCMRFIFVLIVLGCRGQCKQVVCVIW